MQATYKDKATAIYDYIKFAGDNNKDIAIKVIEKDLNIAYLDGQADGLTKAKEIIWEHQ
jgi:hypothetical protein